MGGGGAHRARALTMQWKMLFLGKPICRSEVNFDIYCHGIGLNADRFGYRYTYATHLWCMCLPRLYIIRMQLHVNALYLMLPRAAMPANAFAHSKCNIDTIEMASKLNRVNANVMKKKCDWTAFAFYLAHDTMPLPMTWSISGFVWGKRMRMEPCLYQNTWQGFEYMISQDIVYSIVWWDLKYTPKRNATTSTMTLEMLIWSETWSHLSVNDNTKPQPTILFI